MDLYDAIEIVENFINSGLLYGWGGYLSDETIEAIKICLEAARDKAGV